MAELKDTNINGTLSISATSSGDDVADVYAELKAIKQAHQDLLDSLEDSGWQEAEILSPFKMYGETGGIWYRKIGKWVEISGIVSTQSSFQSSITEQNMCILPEGYRPNTAFYTLCQGSGRNIWLLTVRINGAVQFSRYHVLDTYPTVAKNVWLPVHTTFSVL